MCMCMENYIINKKEEMENEGYERLPNFEDENHLTPPDIKDNEKLNAIIISNVIENSLNDSKIKLSLSQEQIYVVHPIVQSNVNKEQTNKSWIDLTKSIANKTLTKIPSMVDNDIQIQLTIDFERNSSIVQKEEKSELFSEYLMKENERSNFLGKFNVRSTNDEQTAVTHVLNAPVDGLDEQFKCSLCSDAFQDPRVLDCLHSFCFECLNDIELVRGAKIKGNDLCELDLSCAGKTSESTFPNSFSVTSSMETEQKKINSLSRTPLSCQRQTLKDKKSSVKQNKGRLSCISYTENQKTIQCPKCFHETDVPNGGINHLPQNLILAKKVKEALLKFGMVSCSLCYTQAIAYCMTCNANLCGFCIQAHSRQRSTLMHEIRYLSELKNDCSDDEQMKKSLTCILHPDHELKLFCTTCLQLACSSCTLHLHRGHKCEAVRRATRNYLKLIKDSLGKTRPIKDCANDSISKLSKISKSIAERAEVVQNDVEIFLAEYFKALDVHRKTLLIQISRTKETKLASIKDQQIDLAQRANEADAVIKFTDEILSNITSDIEILSYIGVLLRRFEYCQKSKIPLDSKTSDTLKFLPDVRAPMAKVENNVVIPLFGIITTQIAVPKFCSLQSDGLMFLRIHRKAEIIMISKDCYDKQLIHGGLSINVELKYKDSSKHIPTDVSDKRDGTYIISFIPEIVGYLNLTVAINDKPIKGSPYKLCVRTLRVHSGVFHCCSFCSSKGSKVAKCACGCNMPGGYKGCGHGHSGHPGRRHWSCCGSDIQTSECSATNSFRTQ